LEHGNVELSAHEGHPNRARNPVVQCLFREHSGNSVLSEFRFALETLGTATQVSEAILPVGVRGGHNKPLRFQPSPCLG
jgi:hypothetical protein